MTTLQCQQVKLLEREVAAKEADNADWIKAYSTLETSFNVCKAQVAQLQQQNVTQEKELASKTRLLLQLETQVQSGRNTVAHLQHQAQATAGKNAALYAQLKNVKNAQQAAKQESELASAQLRIQEAASAAMETALQRAQRDAEKTGRIAQAAQEAAEHNKSVKQELARLGIELIREQHAMLDAVNLGFPVSAEQGSSPTPCSFHGAATDHVQCEGLGVSTSSKEDGRLSDQSSITALQHKVLALKKKMSQLEGIVAERDEKINRLERDVEIRRGSDTAMQELANLRMSMLAKDRQLQAAKAEIASLRATKPERMRSIKPAV